MDNDKLKHNYSALFEVGTLISQAKVALYFCVPTNPANSCCTELSVIDNSIHYDLSKSQNISLKVNDVNVESKYKSKWFDPGKSRWHIFVPDSVLTILL
jgi:hypothetical protein